MLIELSRPNTFEKSNYRFKIKAKYKKNKKVVRKERKKLIVLSKRS